jgi:hypothetical protein
VQPQQAINAVMLNIRAVDAIFLLTPLHRGTEIVIKML